MVQQSLALDIEDLRETIANILDIDTAEVTDDADFVEELDMDSLLALEILVSLERKYQVKIGEEHMKEVRSLRSTYSLLAAKLESA
ncbi:polyketide-8 synthase acyl carrier protein [Streptomyces sp. NRRL B-1140]|uniref:acyl carrier protein n=1 Tax=Streptomyces sp. NRRL B-1140 TaxID=1415549 RepID=UPI0003C97359|nr:acyl carrier protein [Streptomyces sp. NRRL B-1140]AGZ94345.1 acyl-carrier protein [Streptomyces sp. NRRL B-1140]KOX06503.1 polyketide-8 synthase acyl carrier protein [Streptomyces sp. NRRL B-1140]